MKPNLQDFPKLSDYEDWEGEIDVEAYANAVGNWKRDFEAELRQLFKEMWEKGFVNAVQRGQLEKEILGETP